MARDILDTQDVVSPCAAVLPCRYNCNRVGAPQLQNESCNISIKGCTQEGVTEDAEGGRSQGETSPTKKKKKVETDSVKQTLFPLHMPHDKE